MPTWRPASSRMCVISRVTVLLPFVPLIDTIGMRRSASRSSVGGVVRAAVDPGLEPARAGAPARRSARADRAGDTPRSASWNAASAISCARSAPRHGTSRSSGRDPTSDGRRGPPRPSPWSRAQAAEPRRRARTTSPGQSRGGTGAREADERMRGRGRAAPYQVRRRPTATSTFDRRFEPIDVGTFEQPDLDEAHGAAGYRRAGPDVRAGGRSHAGRAAAVGRADWPTLAGHDPRRARRRRHDRPSWPPPHARRAVAAGLPRRPRRRSSTSTAAATRRPASTGSAAGRRGSSSGWALTVAIHPNATLGDTVVGVDRRRARRAAAAADRPPGHGLPGGHGRGAAVSGRGRPRLRTRRDRHEERPAGRPVRPHGAARARRGTAGERRWLPFERVVFVANPDEEIGSPASGRRSSATLARDADLLLRPRVRPRQRRHRVGPQGHRRPARHDRGRAAHAGVEPEKGRSAILEAAHQIQALHALTGRWPGVTCNVGVDRRRHPAERRGRARRARGRPARARRAPGSRRPRQRFARSPRSRSCRTSRSRSRR